MKKIAFIQQKPWVQSHRHIRDSGLQGEMPMGGGDPGPPCSPLIFLQKVKLLSGIQPAAPSGNGKWTLDRTEQTWQLCDYQTRHRPCCHFKVAPGSLWQSVPHFIGSRICTSGLGAWTLQLENCATLHSHQISHDSPGCPENESVCFVCSWEDRCTRVCS